MATTNDKEFREKLAALPMNQQRQVAALFVRRVLAFSDDVRIKAALDMAMRTDISDAELAVVYQAANTARVESYTQCGKETDWNTQAGLFVAKAVEMIDQLQIALDAQRGVFVGGMKRRHEDAVAQPDCHGSCLPPRSFDGCGCYVLRTGAIKRLRGRGGKMPLRITMGLGNRLSGPLHASPCLHIRARLGLWRRWS